MDFIISGSVTSGYGIPDEIPRWDKVLSDHILERKFDSICVDGMTHENALKILYGRDLRGEILILYFGTRIGWPKISNQFKKNLPYKLGNNGFLDLPAYYSVRKSSRRRRVLKRIIRMFIKSLGILFKQYKPELPKEKMLSDLDHLLTMAAKNFDHVFYIQHHHLSSRRLKYESKKYDAYYELLFNAVRSRSEVNIHLVEMPKDIFTSEFFLPDCVHFSEQGHFKFGLLLAQTLRPLIKSI